MRQGWLLAMMLAIAISGYSYEAFGGGEADRRSPDQQLAVNAALDALIYQGAWDGAQKVVQRYLGHPIHNAPFFEKAIAVYWHHGAYERARGIAQEAQKLYPYYAPFYRYHALLLARGGHCQRARAAWSRYLVLAYFPVSSASQAGFDGFCETTITQNAGIAASAVRDERLAPIIGSHLVQAEAGSQLDELCALLAGLCPADQIFTSDTPPPPRNALVLRYHSEIVKQHNWRHGFAVRLALSQHGGGYRKRQAHLYARWSYRLSARHMMLLRLGVRQAIIPSFERYGAHRTLTPYLQWSMQEQLSPSLRAELVWRHNVSEVKSAGRSATTHHDSVTNALYWQASGHQEAGVRLLADSIRPSQNDAYGRQVRKGFGLHYTHRNLYNIAITIGYERTVTRFEKTLPFLRRPHRIAEKRTFLSLSPSQKDLFGITPFVTLDSLARRSDNPRQQGKKHSISVGLSFMF